VTMDFTRRSLTMGTPIQDVIGLYPTRDVSSNPSLTYPLPAPSVITKEVPVIRTGIPGELLTHATDKIVGNEKMLRMFEVIGEIGRGGSGRVFYGKHVFTDSPVAIKYVPKSDDLDRSQNTQLTAEREIRAGKVLQHVSGIVKLLRTFETEKSIVIVMEFATHGTLSSIIPEKGFPCERDVWTLFVQIAQALYEMHKLDWAHRDIKPDNILLFGGEWVIPKLGDLGLACHIDDGEDTQLLAGSAEYVAPEVYFPVLRIRKKNDLGKMVKWIDPFRVDVYALGVLLYVMFTMQPVPFVGNSDERRVFVSGILSDTRIPSESARKLIVQMLNRDPLARISMEGVVQHSWVLTEPLTDVVTEKKCLPDLRRPVKRARSNPEVTRQDRGEEYSPQFISRK